MADEPGKRFLAQLKLDGVWDNMSPTHRRGAVVVGGIAAVFLLIALITGGDETVTSRVRETVRRSVITDADTRSIGIDALNAKVKGMEAENKKLRTELEGFHGDIIEVKRRRGNDPDMDREVEILRGQVKALTDKAKTLGWEVADIKEGYYQPPEDTSSGEGGKRDAPTEPTLSTEDIVPAKPLTPPQTDPVVEENLSGDPAHYFKTPPVRPLETPAPAAGPKGLTPRAATVGGLRIVTVASVAQASDDKAATSEVFLPAGSIVSGVMLNGLDAATGRGARDDPFPVLVRVQKDALLPNDFRADVKECFATLAGYGELSAERAYLRGETFSCITRTGEIIEETFPSYAVGEDGKAGIRGRLVTKAGSLIAKTALAGFAAGIAEAFDSSPVPVIQTENVDSRRVYQDNWSSDTAQHGVATGASEAMSRVADYYMDMADQMFPVIEVDGGRQIDMVLTSGFKLSPKTIKTIKTTKTTKPAKKD